LGPVTIFAFRGGIFRATPLGSTVFPDRNENNVTKTRFFRHILVVRRTETQKSHRAGWLRLRVAGVRRLDSRGAVLDCRNKSGNDGA
jgi:hypothetical protein